VNLALHHFDLRLQHEFRISRESISVQPTLIAELEFEGVKGYGEATTNAYYGMTLESMVRAIAGVRARIEAYRPDDPEGLWQTLAESLREQPFALCAVDQAAHDLHGKLRGQPLYQMWGLADRPRPLSDYTIGIDEIDVMVAKLREKPDWPIYKIKLGTDRDLEIVRELRQHTSAVFRVDANCGWTPDETIANSSALVPLGVEFIEQPLPAGDWVGQRQVYEHSALSIIADESCLAEGDVDRCAGSFHGVNIKLPKCGGLTPARRMIDRARELGLKVMVGCMTESTVGISAIAQLLPLLDYVDMDGAVLLAADIATGVRVERGVCQYADENGTGARLLSDQRIDF
jgi:L-alanine-DL-glutamate epimerase-like enolase superfamily enzyme